MNRTTCAKGKIVLNAQLNVALAEVRLPPHRIASMIQEAAHATGDEALQTRLREERPYHQQAAYMTQGIVLGFTLAQTMNEEVDFKGMFKNAQLAQDDVGLAKLGRQLVEWMAEQPVAQGADVTRALFDERVGLIAAAI